MDWAPCPVLSVGRRKDLVLRLKFHSHSRVLVASRLSGYANVRVYFAENSYCRR